MTGIHPLDDEPTGPPPFVDRRGDPDAAWRSYIVQRLDRQDELMRRMAEMLAYFTMGKLLGGIVKWLAITGAAAATVWAAIHYGPGK